MNFFRRAAVPLEAASASSPHERKFERILIAIALAAQLLYLFANSVVAIHHGALTSDFQYNAQAVYEIGQGNLNPRWGGGSVQNRYLDDHGEILMYAFGPLSRIFPTLYLLKFAQDLSIVGASFCVWLLIARAIATLPAAKTRWAARFLAATLIAANPWTYWTNLFDFHVQTFAIGFLLAGIYFAVTYRRTIAIAMFACVVGLGDVAGTYAIGSGLSLMFVPQARIVGAVVTAMAIADFEVIAKMKSGSTGQVRIGDIYGYVLDPGQDKKKAGLGKIVVGALRHPDRVFSRFEDQLPNVLANLAPGGYIGAFHPLVVGPVWITLAESALTGSEQYAQPGSQNGPLYPLTALGTSLFLIEILRRRAFLGTAASALIAANGIAWAIAFFPLERSHWIRLSPEAASELNVDLRTIPRDHQVVINQGSSGLFSERENLFQDVGAIRDGAHVPTDVILTPYDGINAATSSQIARQVTFWLFEAHGKLVSRAANVWHFAFASWPPKVSLARVIAASDESDDDAHAHLPAWIFRTLEGRAVIRGTSDASFVRATGARGFVAGDAYPYLRPGAYRISVRLLSRGPLILEVYDPYRRRFVARKPLGPTHGVVRESVDVAIPPEFETYGDLEAGDGFFSYKAARLHYGRDKLLLRVYNPGGTQADVYSFDISPLSDS